MPDDFQYDVFLSHSSKDQRSKTPTLLHDTGGNAVVRPLAERLRADGVQLESGTFRFRDPLNKERRFPPLRLDDAPIKGSQPELIPMP